MWHGVLATLACAPHPADVHNTDQSGIDIERWATPSCLLQCRGTFGHLPSSCFRFRDMSDHHPSPAAKAERSAEPRSLRIEDWLTVIIMALLALITFANVLVRYFTDASFAWTEEISIFLMIVLAHRVFHQQWFCSPKKGAGASGLCLYCSAFCHHRCAQHPPGLG